MYTYKSDEASVIKAGLDLAASSYKKLSVNDDLPPLLQRQFLEYGNTLERIAADVADAHTVIFKDYHDQ